MVVFERQRILSRVVKSGVRVQLNALRGRERVSRSSSADLGVGADAMNKKH